MSVNSWEIEKGPNIVTPRGIVFLKGPLKSNCLKKLNFNKGLNNFRPSFKQKEFLVDIAGRKEGMVYVACNQTEVIGYLCFHYPSKYSRWSRHPRVIEVGTIEVAPEWRKFKIITKLIHLAFSNPVIEEYIVITIEFCWHWDLEQTGMDVWQYQKMLTRLFNSVGLQKIPTDDPDILEHPANVLMARFGKKVSEADIKLFKELQFDTSNRRRLQMPGAATQKSVHQNHQGR